MNVVGVYQPVLELIKMMIYLLLLTKRGMKKESQFVPQILVGAIKTAEV